MLPIQSAGPTLTSPIACGGLGHLSGLDSLGAGFAFFIMASFTVLPRPRAEFAFPSTAASEGQGQLIVSYDSEGQPF